MSAPQPSPPLAAAIPYVPLASKADMEDSPFHFMLDGASTSYVNAVMIRASMAIESRCARRFVPFTNLTQTERAEGVAQDVFGGAGIPMSMMSSLEMSRARAYGGGDNLVRDVWLSEVAVRDVEKWTYSDVSVQVVPPFGGGGQLIVAGANQLAQGQLEGPYPDTGHMRLPFGTYCPPGSEIIVIYSGGYTLGYPGDLVEASCLQAAKTFIRRTAPEGRANLSTLELQADIDELIAPFLRY